MPASYLAFWYADRFSIFLNTDLYTTKVYSWVSIIQIDFKICTLTEQFFACSTNLKQGAGKKGPVRIISRATENFISNERSGTKLWETARTTYLINKVISYLFRTMPTLFMVGLPQASQTLSPINPSANPSLISLGDRTPKVIIVAKTVFPFRGDQQNKLPKAVPWTSGTVRFKLDDVSPIAILSAVFINTGHYFVVSNVLTTATP